MYQGVMYQDIETMREHHQALLAEVGEARLARQLRRARPKRKTFPGKMRRRAALLLFVMGLAMVLVASVAYALEVQCPPSVEGVVCLGTDGLDSIVGLGDSDIIHGLENSDQLTGDGNAAASQGDDQLFGGTS